MSEKYFLYARKSTDVEDKQVLSIEAQVTELRKFAADNDLQIVDTIIEKRTANTPGRPKFGNMLARIEAGEASEYQELSIGEHMWSQALQTYRYLREKVTRGELQLPERARGTNTFGHLKKQAQQKTVNNP